MSDRTQEAVEFGGRTVPPATPPVINDNASAVDAATLPKANGDSDQLGETPQEVPEQPIMPSEAPPPD